MIFVTVGKATQGFRRLIDAIDKLAEEGVFGDDAVFIQSGNNPLFFPSHCKHQPFLSMVEFAAKIQEANLIICHAGAGTLFHVLRAGKVPVVMPRRKRYAELVNDHQVELVKALAEEGRIVPAFEPEDLPGAIMEAKEENAKRGAGGKGLGIKGLGDREEVGIRRLTPDPIIPNPMLGLVERAVEEMVRK